MLHRGGHACNGLVCEVYVLDWCFRSAISVAVANVHIVSLKGIGGVRAAPVQHGAVKWALPRWGLAPDRSTQGTACPPDPVVLARATSSVVRSSPSVVDDVISQVSAAPYGLGEGALSSCGSVLESCERTSIVTVPQASPLGVSAADMPTMCEEPETQHSPVPSVNVARLSTDSAGYLAGVP